MEISGNIPITQVTAALGVIIVAIAGALPSIKRKLSGKKIHIISLPVAEFLQALRDYSNYTIQIVELRRSIEKKQKLAATDASDLLKTKLVAIFNQLIYENGLDEDIKEEFDSAVEIMLLNMRRKMYDIFEANHFIEREDWPAFLAMISSSLYQEGYNRLIKQFPKHTEIPKFYNTFKGVENEFKREIEKTFDNAKKIILHVNAEVKEIEAQQDQHIQVKYIDCQN